MMFAAELHIQPDQIGNLPLDKFFRAIAEFDVLIEERKKSN